MTRWPKTLTPEDAPHALVQLVEDLMPRLLAGEHPSLSVLRSQLESSRLESVELTGAGFYVHFAVDAAAPRVAPSGFFGGEAQIRLAGLERGLGCMIHVREGRIATLEGFTYQEDWPEEFRVLAVEEVMAMEPPAIPG